MVISPLSSNRPDSLASYQWLVPLYQFLCYFVGQVTPYQPVQPQPQQFSQTQPSHFNFQQPIGQVPQLQQQAAPSPPPQMPQQYQQPTTPVPAQPAALPHREAVQVWLVLHSAIHLLLITHKAGAMQGEGLGAWAPNFRATWSTPLILFRNIPIAEDETLSKTWHFQTF